MFALRSLISVIKKIFGIMNKRLDQISIWWVGKTSKISKRGDVYLALKEMSR